MSLNNLIKEVSDSQLKNMKAYALEEEEDTSSLVDSGNGSSNSSSRDNCSYKGIDTRKLSASTINAIFSNGEINIADVDTRYTDAVNLHVVKNWRVAQIGAGGIGSPTVQTLVGMGIRDYTLFDDDIVEVHNCGPQMHPITNIGKPKVQSTAEQMYAFRGVTINERQERVHSLKDLISQNKIYDVIINSVDNMDIRRTLGWELLSDVFEKYKGFQIAMPRFVQQEVKFYPEDAVPIEKAIPTLLKDCNVILKYIKEDLKVKNLHEWVLVDTKKLHLSQLSIQMLKLHTSTLVKDLQSRSHTVNNIATSLEIDNIDVGIDTAFYYNYLQAPFIYEDKMCIKLYSILALLLIIDMYFIHVSMYSEIYNNIYTKEAPLVSVNILKDKESLKFVLNELTVHTESKLIVLPVYPNQFLTHPTSLIENIEKLCAYIESNVPEVYIDSRMSLGTWNTYTLPLKDAAYQSVYAYWHIMGSMMGTAEYFESNKQLPQGLLKVIGINFNEADMDELKQTLFLSNKWGIASAFGKVSDIASEYILNLLYSKVSSSMCLCEFLTEALFDGSEAIQEPCTARAIVYTGVNIASYIGAVLHYISSRPYIAGDIRYFVKSKMASDEQRKAYSPEKIFNQANTGIDAPFRWRYAFNSRSFLSNSDAAIEKVTTFMNKYRDKASILNSSLEGYKDSLKKDLDDIFDKQNVWVIDYIGAVLHIATKDYKYKDTYALLDIHKNTSNNVHIAECGLLSDTINLSNGQIGYLYVIWLLWLLSCGYITIEDLTVSNSIVDKVPYVKKEDIDSVTIQSLLVNKSLTVDNYLWNEAFKEDSDNIGNSLLTLMASYREVLRDGTLKESLNSLTDLNESETVLRMYQMLTTIINKHILQIMIDSTALGMSNIAPNEYRLDNIATLLIDNFSSNVGIEADNINIVEHLSANKVTSIESAFVFNYLSLDTFYKGSEDSPEKNCLIGQIKDDFLLEVYERKMKGLDTHSPLLNRLHYPVQFLCNIICKNSFSDLDLEDHTHKINRYKVVQQLLDLDNGEADRYADMYLDDLSLLITSNSIKFNGSTLKVVTYIEETMTILTEDTLIVPMSFDNYAVNNYNRVMNYYIRKDTEIKMENSQGEQISSNLQVNINTIRLLNNLEKARRVSYIHSDIADKFRDEIDKVDASFKEIRLEFPLTDTQLVTITSPKNIKKGSVKRLKIERTIPKVSFKEKPSTVILIDNVVDCGITKALIHTDTLHGSWQGSRIPIITVPKEYITKYFLKSTSGNLIKINHTEEPLADRRHYWYDEYGYEIREDNLSRDALREEAMNLAFPYEITPIDRGILEAALLWVADVMDNSQLCAGVNCLDVGEEGIRYIGNLDNSIRECVMYLNNPAIPLDRGNNISNLEKQITALVKIHDESFDFYSGERLESSDYDSDDDNDDDIDDEYTDDDEDESYNGEF